MIILKMKCISIINDNFEFIHFSYGGHMGEIGSEKLSLYLMFQSASVITSKDTKKGKVLLQ